MDEGGGLVTLDQLVDAERPTRAPPKPEDMGCGRERGDDMRASYTDSVDWNRSMSLSEIHPQNHGGSNFTSVLIVERIKNILYCG